MGTHRPEKYPLPAKTKGRSAAYEKDENDSRWNFSLARRREDLNVIRGLGFGVLGRPLPNTVW